MLDYTYTHKYARCRTVTVRCEFRLSGRPMYLRCALLKVNARTIVVRHPCGKIVKRNQSRVLPEDWAAVRSQMQ